MEWILILFIHTGAIGAGNAMTIASVPGFASEQECSAAGAKSQPLTQGTVKESRFVCVSRTK